MACSCRKAFYKRSRWVLKLHVGQPVSYPAPGRRKRLYDMRPHDACFTSMTTIPNSPDRQPARFLDREELVAEVGRSDIKEVCTFATCGQTFRVLSTFREMLGCDHGDDNDRDAINAGFTELWRIVAVGEDGRPYAVWEFYIAPNERYLSKVIEVDYRVKGRGIGTAFILAVRKMSKFEWSGWYTHEGARLKDRVEAAEAEAELQKATPLPPEPE